MTQGRGISIHRADCPNLLTLNSEGRRVDIDWQEVEGEAFSVRLSLSGEDRRGLYADIMAAISATGTNIRSADIHTKDGTVFGTVFVEVDNIAHLAKVLKAVRRVKGVGGGRAPRGPGHRRREPDDAALGALLALARPISSCHNSPDLPYPAHGGTSAPDPRRSRG